MSTDTDLTVLTRDNLRDREGGVWSYISPSRLNLWLKCPLAYKLKYYDGLETPMSPAQFIGRRVHDALEVFYRHRQVGLALEKHDLVERMETSWAPAIEADGMRFTRTEDERASWKQTVELVSAYLAQVPEDESKPLAVETAVEAPLVDPVSGEDLGLPLVGVIDLVLDEPAGPVIADFKTTSRGGELAEITVAVTELAGALQPTDIVKVQRAPRNALIRSIVPIPPKVAGRNES